MDATGRHDGEGRGAGPGDRKLRVAVLGPGGVGGLVGALLQRDGHEVTCLAGEATAAHLAAHGLQLRSDLFGEFTVPVQTAAVLDRPVDVCFVTPKMLQLDAALERVPAAALGGALLVPFCNGIEHVERLRARYPADQVVAATIRVESTRVAPGRIEQAGPFAIVDIAPGPADRERVEALAGHLATTGLHVTVREDETAMLWDKLAMLGPLALATTLARAPVGEARVSHGDDLRAIVREVAAVARAEGAELDADAIVALVDRVPAPMMPSMLRDHLAGRLTEVDAIGGVVVRTGERHGVPTPVTARTVAVIKEREAARARADGGGAAAT